MCGVDLSSLDGDRLARFRLHNMGVVFQFHNLVPELTALDNVALPAVMAGLSVSEARRRARELLESLGLAVRALHRPHQLSRGERQRVAIARALINSPKLLLCDEPTGSLDYESKLVVLDLLQRVNPELGTTVIVATHDPLVASRATRLVKLVGGRIAEDRRA